ncbi:type II cytosine-specific DNA methyltransferase [Malaciobacter marinus]|uniref:Cytosine-specific methyltransferase n=2 Tax=Arcobacteraceae TaxID=2808963 RepID=A0A347TIT5_9BACT|nr:MULTISPECIES: DNA cytosine methyltransferase [Arcobacteraceae]AXX86513.1 type II cytosine-specific DNA methyltransferase [Malaciobacter marinus]PHO14091.1 restriction endonuclease [Malaciobacter marinus]RXK11674.1 restriction endonuclease [Halarcobacter mediterraneus]
MKKKYTFIDLFAGAGGFAEGFYQEGYKALSHVEFDKYACDTLKERMRFYKYNENEIEKVKPTDITSENILKIIDDCVQDNDVDVIIGGPPCQSFSSQGKARDPHGMKKDPRNYLYENYIKVLNHYKPKFFVFENVSGILSTKVNGELIIHKIYEDMKKNYKIIEDKDKILLNAVDFGVPQERKRVILIGVRRDLNIDVNDVYNELNEVSKKIEKVTVEEAISDLPSLLPGEGKDLVKFRPKKVSKYLEQIRPENYDYLHHHVARNHNSLDKERYKHMSKNKWTLEELYENKAHLIHPKKRLFNNSYVVQFFDKPSKTIIAHLYKDGNQFIHPDHSQERTLTPREAARLQSFPDNFVFPCSKTQQYKQIGNAVPPLFAKQIAKVLKKFLSEKN